MKIALITDTHLGHNKLIEYEGRPKNHSEIILSRLNSFLGGGKYDVLIHLGDICIGCDETWHETLFGGSTPIVAKNVKKWLVLGNHDKKSLSWYLNHGWDMVCNQLTLERHGKTIIFSHRPEAIEEYKSAFENYINIHGHLHGNDHRLDVRSGGIKAKLSDEDGGWYLSERNILLALEKHNYMPWDLNSIISNYAKT